MRWPWVWLAAFFALGTASENSWAAKQRGFSTVVIDAGHGGHDLGGIRSNIILEKGVALDVALRLQKHLKAAGLHTVLTRSSDVFVTLGRRVAISNSQSNAIFVSIHFNSAYRVGARGIETFHCSPAGAKLASRIQCNAMRTTPGDNRGIKRASFYVLRKNRHTAVLIEGGFLTNAQDAALANRKDYREKLAFQIASAILEYRRSL
ncbi:MAG: N-acetylmuramoyl-L-alanine amidase [Terrimicrobiaceae bacterium]|jgi:N-acetylmuramoyl-L-alanine amidase|nr:N-acetylmuramoyl-L-alanine amidase [Terrimicrobiaceae bacterium]